MYVYTVCTCTCTCSERHVCTMYMVKFQYTHDAMLTRRTASVLSMKQTNGIFVEIEFAKLT